MNILLTLYKEKNAHLHQHVQRLFIRQLFSPAFPPPPLACLPLSPPLCDLLSGSSHLYCSCGPSSSSDSQTSALSGLWSSESAVALGCCSPASGMEELVTVVLAV